jgi:hypothetical protein
MASTTDFDDGLFQQKSHVRGVGGVAGQTLSCSHRRVNVLFREHCLVMTSITEIRWIRVQEFIVFACMRIVAGGATHAYGGVYGLFVKKRFIMTSVAQVRLFCRKSLRDLICHFMRDITRIYTGMAGRTTHSNGGMNAFPFSKILMALKAVDFSRRCWGVNAEQGEQRNRHNKGYSHGDLFSSLLGYADKKRFSTERQYHSIIRTQNQDGLTFVSSQEQKPRKFT